MGLIAFYAGLLIGILIGLCLTSLFAFYLAGKPVRGLPDQADGYSRREALEP
jgi:hypothetical protein